MSDNIIPFNNGNEEEPESCCSTCELAKEYFGVLLEVLENGQIEDVYGVIRELAEEAKHLGVIEYLEDELEHKAHLLDGLKYGFED